MTIEKSRQIGTFLKHGYCNHCWWELLLGYKHVFIRVAPVELAFFYTLCMYRKHFSKQTMLDFYYVLTLGLCVPAIDFFFFENFCSILRCLSTAVNPSLPFLIVNQDFRSSYDIFINFFTKRKRKTKLLLII